ncbi:hypothetical protein POF50_004135 [Streptomyces sp. SL13]|uniref:Uncharacterized protein n=1 Tax=Streptantibioticus silvisoli TaxID=2705255 RepID=A0AA90H5M4_9ACTN|nr:hypothetical protein [Streptantibioticus silvisoli]MDI5963279.1 hypothetical protein [Streptantibioticus silvisoli]MDI5968542.1 hypothetical protein [Streptantibioticus silvisoli]
MTTEHTTMNPTMVLDIDVENALNPAEMEGTFHDTRECAALALLSGTATLLLSPPTPRPKKS